MARKTRNKSQLDDALNDAASDASASDDLGRPGGMTRPPMARTAESTSGSLLDDLPALVVGLTAAVLPRLVEPGIRDLYQLPKQFAMTVGAAWMLAAVALLAVMRRPVSIPQTPLRWPLLGMAASVAISVAIASDETGGETSLFAKMDAFRWGAAIVLALLCTSTVRTSRQLLYVVGGMLVGGLQVAIFGIAQHHNIAALLPADARSWVGINAPGSTFGNRNMAAQLIVSVMPAAYVLVAMSLRWWRHDRVQKALIYGGTGTFLLFLLLYYLRLSVTRSAWGGAGLGLLVAIGLYALGHLRRQSIGKDEDADEARELAARPRRPVLPLVLGLGASGVVAIALASTLLIDAGFSARYDEGVGDKKRRMSITELVETIGDTEDSHWAMRRMMWASTWEAIKARPFGGGAGNWRVLFPQYVVQRQANDHFSIAKQPVRAHNDFLQIWSEFGVQGFVSFMALIVICMWMAFRTRARSLRPRLQTRDDVAWLTLGALSSVAGMVAICGDALLSFPFQLPAPTFFFFVHIGVIGAAWLTVRRIEAEVYPQQDDIAERRAVPAPLVGGSLVALVAVAVIAVGFVHWENGRLLEAEKGFTFARAKQKRNQASAGLIEIQKAIAINPDDFQNHFIEGLCYNSLGDMPKAIASIERSLALYPNLLNAWVNLAMFAQKAGDEDKMKRAIDAALALKPDEAYALNTWTRWLNGKGRFDETIAALEPFLEIHHDNDTLLSNLGKAYERKGRWADVAKVRTFEVGNVTSRPIPPGSPNYAARRAAEDKRILEARRDGWFGVGEAYNKAERWADAAGALRKAAELAGRSRPDIKREYAIALARSGDFARASGQAAVTMELDPSQEGQLLAALGRLKLDSKDEATTKELDAIIARVRRMAEVAAGK